jgi:hypothetical protein
MSGVTVREVLLEEVRAEASLFLDSAGRERRTANGERRPWQERVPVRCCTHTAEDDAVALPVNDLIAITTQNGLLRDHVELSDGVRL